jgi:hypothetical protein
MYIAKLKRNTSKLDNRNIKDVFINNYKIICNNDINILIINKNK